MDQQNPGRRRRYKFSKNSSNYKDNTQQNSTEPSFVPPERIAAEEMLDVTETKKTNNLKSSKKINLPAWITKKHMLVAGILAFLGLATLITIALFQRSIPETYNPEVVKQEKVVEEAPKPTTEASKLTGLQVEPALNSRMIQAVMIENSPDARPQSGLLQAGVVYEAIAEGGITRFLAVFQESQPEYIGPVRSARPYYVEWARGYDAGYAHAGGSPEAISLIGALGVKDMGDSKGYFYRVSSRYAPHNLYTDMAKLDAYRQLRGYTTSSFTPFARKTEAASSSVTARVIDMDISSPLYDVRYEYDPSTNSYKRFLGGKPHTDEKSGQQLSPKVVIALVTTYSIHADRIHSVYKTTGSGTAIVYQDGVVTNATWKKDSQTASLEIVDASGKALALNPGQTWITAVTDGKVTHTP